MDLPQKFKLHKCFEREHSRIIPFLFIYVTNIYRLTSIAFYNVGLKDY